LCYRIYLFLKKSCCFNLCSNSFHGNIIGLVMMNLEIIVYLATFFCHFDLDIDTGILFALIHTSLEDGHHVVSINISEKLENRWQCVLFDEVINFSLNCINLLLLRLSLVKVWALVRSCTTSCVRFSFHLINWRCQVIIISHHFKLLFLFLQLAVFPFFFHLLVCFDTEDFGN